MLRPHDEQTTRKQSGNWNPVTIMPEKKDKPTSKTEKLLKKVLGRRYTFEGSQADLELLRSIYEGTCANAKPGDPSFHAYAAAVNTTSEFATQALIFSS